MKQLARVLLSSFRSNWIRDRRYAALIRDDNFFVIRRGVITHYDTLDARPPTPPRGAGGAGPRIDTTQFLTLDLEICRFGDPFPEIGGYCCNAQQIFVCERYCRACFGAECLRPVLNREKSQEEETRRLA